MSTEYTLVPATRSSSYKTNWMNIFDVIEPGMAARMLLTRNQIKSCRVAIRHHKKRGKYRDLYTYTEDGFFFIARQKEE